MSVQLVRRQVLGIGEYRITLIAWELFFPPSGSICAVHDSEGKQSFVAKTDCRGK